MIFRKMWMKIVSKMRKECADSPKISPMRPSRASRRETIVSETVVDPGAPAPAIWPIGFIVWARIFGCGRRVGSPRGRMMPMPGHVPEVTTAREIGRTAPICRHYRAPIYRRGQGNSAYQNAIGRQRISRGRPKGCGRGRPPKLPSRKALGPLGLGGDRGAEAHFFIVGAFSVL
jgi:hypothetical protein